MIPLKLFNVNFDMKYVSCEYSTVLTFSCLPLHEKLLQKWGALEKIHSVSMLENYFHIADKFYIVLLRLDSGTSMEEKSMV